MVTAIKGNDTSTFGGTITYTAPAFSAYQGTGQTISNNTLTKITYDTEHFDINSNYDHTTNYRFIPTVAGYYQFNLRAELTADYTGDVYVALYKNGSRVHVVGSRNDGVNQGVGGSVLVYANGSTDYFEGYIFQNTGASRDTSNYAQGSHFQAYLVRAV